MKRKVKFQEGGAVQEPMTAAERRRQNIQRLNERRSANRMSASERAEVERFNERMRQGTLTPDDMRRMGGRSEIERFSERAQRGTLTADDMRRMGGTPTPQAGGSAGGGAGGGGRGGAMVPSGGDRLPAPRPSSGELMRQGAGMGGGTPRTGPRVVGGAAGPAAAGVAIGLAGEALNRYLENRRNRPITGNYEQGMEPEGSNEAADAERERQASQRAPAPAPRPAAPARPAARPAPRRPAQREMSAEERQAFMERMMREEADREAAARQPERGFFERLGLRRTNETGLEPGTEARMRDMYGSQYSSQYNMKQGGKVKAYREGGAIRQGMQSPKAQEGRAEMAEDVMRRERAREPISDKERKAGRAEAAMDSGPLTDAEKERMRSSGFKKGGMIKPKAKTAMKKGGAVKAPAKKMKSGGKVAPKKMMKGGKVAAKPAKKMMGGGRAMYAKGGMAKGCK
jgi:hypothetical protein